MLFFLLPRLTERISDSSQTGGELSRNARSAVVSQNLRTRLPLQANTCPTAQDLNLSVNSQSQSGCGPWMQSAVCGFSSSFPVFCLHVSSGLGARVVWFSRFVGVSLFTLFSFLLCHIVCSHLRSVETLFHLCFSRYLNSGNFSTLETVFKTSKIQTRGFEKRTKRQKNTNIDIKESRKIKQK